MAMIELTELPEAPHPSLRYRAYLRPLQAVKELWARRELVLSLAEREVRARYKQATLGFAWAIITPFALMVVFTVFFKRVATIDTGGTPYAIFSYVGLLPWTFFSSSVATGGLSLVTNHGVMNKVACPREVFPLSSVIVAGVDTILAMLALGVLFIINGFAPRATTVWVPVILLVQLAFTIGITLIISSIMVYVRDLKHAIPLVLQMGLFATPVAYGFNDLPESIRGVYAYVNPLGPVIECYRRVVLQGLGPDWNLLAPAAGSAVLFLCAGYVLFQRLETGFADVG